MFTALDKNDNLILATLNSKREDERYCPIVYCHSRLILRLPNEHSRTDQNLRAYPPHYAHPKGCECVESNKNKHSWFYYYWTKLAFENGIETNKNIGDFTVDFLCRNGNAIMLSDRGLSYNQYSRRKMASYSYEIRKAGYKPIWIINEPTVNLMWLNLEPMLNVPDRQKAYLDLISPNNNTYLLVNFVDLVDYNCGMKAIIKPVDIFNLTLPEDREDKEYIYFPKTQKERIIVDKISKPITEPDSMHPDEEELDKYRFRLYCHNVVTNRKYQISVTDKEMEENKINVGTDILVMFNHKIIKPKYDKISRISWIIIPDWQKEKAKKRRIRKSKNLSNYYKLLKYFDVEHKNWLELHYEINVQPIKTKPEIVSYGTFSDILKSVPGKSVYDRQFWLKYLDKKDVISYKEYMNQFAGWKWVK